MAVSEGNFLLDYCAWKIWSHEFTYEGHIQGSADGTAPLMAQLIAKAPLGPSRGAGRGWVHLHQE